MYDHGFAFLVCLPQEGEDLARECLRITQMTIGDSGGAYISRPELVPIFL
jgi:hypothetical protein